MKFKTYLQEARNDSLMRKFHKFMSWDSSDVDTPSPNEMRRIVSNYSDEDLKFLAKGIDKEKPGSGSARSLQNKLIQRELKKRGMLTEGLWDKTVVVDLKNAKEQIKFINALNRAFKKLPGNTVATLGVKKNQVEIFGDTAGAHGDAIQRAIDDHGGGTY